MLSQETEPALGWAYASFLNTLKENPGIDGGQLGQVIVSSYIDDGARITDGSSVSTSLRRGGGFFNARLSRRRDRTTRWGATSPWPRWIWARCLRCSTASTSLPTLQSGERRGVAKALYAQSFTSIFGGDIPASYIDLGNFVQLMQQVGGGGGQIGEPASNAVPANDRPDGAGRQRMDRRRPRDRHLGLLRTRSCTVRRWPARRRTPRCAALAEQSLWDDFSPSTTRSPVRAEQHGACRAAAVERAPQPPARSASAPSRIGRRGAAGRFRYAARAVVDGPNVGYIYFFTGYIDQAGRSIFVADQDYLGAAERARWITSTTRLGRGAFTVEFAWEPLMFRHRGMARTMTVAMQPESYGKDLRGCCLQHRRHLHSTRTASSARRGSYFRDGALQQVMGFTGDGTTGALRITPEIGDRRSPSRSSGWTWTARRVMRTIEQGGTLTLATAHALESSWARRWATPHRRLHRRGPGRVK